MADITKCKGNECPLKNECYRFKANANDPWQSYFTTIPYVEVPNAKEPYCQYFWKMRGEEPQ